MNDNAVPAAVNEECVLASASSTGPICFTVPGIPVAWARAAGGSSVKRFTPTPQRNAMGAIKLFGAAAMRGARPLEGPIHFQVTAIYPWPASWPEWKREECGDWKFSRPDIDNLTKLAADALNGICWLDDAQICSSLAVKKYGQFPGLEIEIRSLLA